MIPLLSLVLLIPTTPYQWKNVQIVGGGFVSGIVTNPKAKGVVYARTDIGGVYRLDPKTRHWIPIEDWITRPDWNLYGAESVAIDPSDPNRVYIAAGTYTFGGIPNGAILSSRDRGRTWRRFDLPFRNGGNMDGRGMGERLMVYPKDGRKLYFGTRSNGLWKSTDAGTTWAQDAGFPVKSSEDGIGIDWVAYGPKSTVVAVAKKGGLYESLDGGSTWSAASGQPTDFIPFRGGFDPLGNLVVTYSNGVGPNGATNGAVWRRTGAGEWANVTPLKPSAQDRFGYAGLSFDRMAPHTFVVSTLDRWGRDTLFRTRDDGSTWTSVAPTARMDASISPFVMYDHEKPDFGHWIHSVEIDPFDSNRAWYGTGATVWTTENLTAIDSGKPTDWHIGAVGIEETADIDLSSPTSGAAIVSALGDIGGFRHTDLDHSPPKGVWRNPYFSNVDVLDFAGLNADLFIRIGRGSGRQHGAFSKDNASTWQPLEHDPPEGRGGGTAAISADGKTIVWCPQGASAPFFTSDLGKTWTKSGSPSAGRVRSDKQNPLRFYLQARSAIYVSDDGAKSFRPAAGDLPKSGVLVPSFAKEGDLWLPTEHGLLHSIDGGQTFMHVPGPDESAEIGLGMHALGRTEPAIYVTGKMQGVDGIFRSVDGGSTWTRINDASTGFGTMGRIEGDPKRFGRVYLGTNGRGVLYGDERR